MQAFLSAETDDCRRAAAVHWEGLAMSVAGSGFDLRAVLGLPVLLGFFAAVLLAVPVKTVSAADDVIGVSDGSGKEEGKERASISAAELEKNRKLILKAIGDLESFRVMFKHIGVHGDDDSRLLLAEEAERFIDDHVDPLINDYLMYAPETFGLVVALNFFKAHLYFEMGRYDSYVRVVEEMEKKYDREHLGVSLERFDSEFRTIGDAVQALNRKINQMSSSR